MRELGVGMRIGIKGRLTCLLIALEPGSNLPSLI